MEKDRSIDLEHGEYAENVELVIEHGIEAVKETPVGRFVQLVTPDTFGNPEVYMVPLLKEIFGDSIQSTLIGQCGCGGYVLRVKRMK